ncbi:MAG: hypothetical protein M3468_00745 [Acidobacteriota bacterium]|nr:hypothetical protein [Acidobacteriota bacterium]
MFRRRSHPLVVAFVLVALAGVGHPSASPEEVISVAGGGSLQQAIDRARPGDTIQLSAGVTYTGNFVLPNKSGNQFITIRTAPADAHPRDGVRVEPQQAASLAKIQSPNGQPALRTAPGAHHWRLQLLEFLPNSSSGGDIIALGDGSSAQKDAAQVPNQLIVDRCYIHGHPERGQKRGIALNSGTTTISNSYISDIKVKGQDSQAIAGWNGPGPYVIENNYLEGAGENFLLGGADPSIQGLVTEDVTFRRNHLAKPLAWRDQGWQIKNLFELKSARRVLVEGNLMEHSWLQAQVGYAILLTPRNQDGRAPWAVVENITIRRNVIRHAGGAITITGADTTHPSGSGPSRAIHIVDNLLYGIDSRIWGGTGAFLLIGDGPSDIVVEHNTVRQNGNIIMAYGGSKQDPLQIRGFHFRDNLVSHNLYGVHGADRAPGGDTLQAFFPGSVFQNNGIAGGESNGYPAGNAFVDEQEFERQFIDAARGDFRLKAGSRFKGAASDRKDLGADFGALASAMGLRPGARIP